MAEFKGGLFPDPQHGVGDQLWRTHRVSGLLNHLRELGVPTHVLFLVNQIGFAGKAVQKFQYIDWTQNSDPITDIERRFPFLGHALKEKVITLGDALQTMQLRKSRVHFLGDDIGFLEAHQLMPKSFKYRGEQIEIPADRNPLIPKMGLTEVDSGVVTGLTERPLWLNLSNYLQVRGYDPDNPFMAFCNSYQARYGHPPIVLARYRRNFMFRVEEGIVDRTNGGSPALRGYLGIYSSSMLIPGNEKHLPRILTGYGISRLYDPHSWAWVAEERVKPLCEELFTSQASLRQALKKNKVSGGLMRPL